MLSAFQVLRAKCESTNLWWEVNSLNSSAYTYFKMFMLFSFCIKVISARKGEFETGFERGGQTREHAMLAKTAGVKHLVVLINKMDDPTVEWSEDRWAAHRVPDFLHWHLLDYLL